ncbi:unnamed protein product [Lampetra planeri]
MSKKAAKRKNLPIDSSDDENDEVVPATAPENVAQPAEPEDRLPSAQGSEHEEPPASTTRRSWRDVAVHLETTLAAVTYMFNMLMAAGRTTSTGVVTDAAALHVASTAPIASGRAVTGPAVTSVASGSASTPPAVCSASLCWLPQVRALSATEGD